jgi:uncharacterized protein
MPTPEGGQKVLQEDVVGTVRHPQDGWHRGNFRAPEASAHPQGRGDVPCGPQCAMPHANHPPADVALLLQDILDELPAPLEPLNPSAIDGYLVGVVLQRVPWEDAWPHIVDPEGEAPRKALGHPGVQKLQSLLRLRCEDLDRAIEQRQWFDPWIFEPDAPDASPREACAPWAAGFALAMDHFPDLMAVDAQETGEALALIYTHFDAEDLEDAESLLELIEELEPATSLDEAVEDLVAATLTLADVTRPQRTQPQASRPSRPRQTTFKPKGRRG